MADMVKDLLSLQYSSNFSLEGIQEENVDLNLPPAPELSATIYGTVTDGGIPVADATIKVFDAAGQPYRHTVTNTAGEYTFSDIPAGSYSLGAVAEGYRLSDLQPVTLTADSTTEVPFAVVKDATLTLGAIAGVVSARLLTGGTMPLAGAKVTMTNALGTAAAVTYTANDGEFVFYDVADGIYSLIATADGYMTATVMAVTIAGGSIANVSMAMDMDTRTYNGTVSGIVKNSSGYVMANCFVGLYRVVDDSLGGTKEVLVAVTKTNTSGKYLFGGVAGGTYLVKAKLNT